MKKRIIDVVCAVFEQNGKIFICKRKLGLKHEGKWEFPGGKVIDGESVLKALRREIKEELNIEIEIGDEVSKVKCFESCIGITLQLLGYYLFRLVGILQKQVLYMFHLMRLYYHNFVLI